VADFKFTHNSNCKDRVKVRINTLIIYILKEIEDKNQIFETSPTDLSKKAFNLR
jgi:hypothetical protein